MIASPSLPYERSTGMVYILLGNGFEEIEAIAPGDILRRGEVEVCYLGVDALNIRGAHGITVAADAVLDAEMPFNADDVFVVPGGLGGVESIEKCEAAMTLLRRAKEAGAHLAAICAGPRVLAAIGALEGRNITCYPGCEEWMTGANVDCDKTVCYDEVLTGRAPGSAIDFGLVLLMQIKGLEVAEDVRDEMVYVR